MAKRLVYNYTFDASAQTVKISGLYTLRTLILITNVTDNIIIYNFADSAAGGTVSYNSANDETTISLTYDTTSMSDTDELQILLDEQQTEIEPGESIVDPVHKMRVSNPENLIDTDFEYGLQSSKWETLELVANIPSVYTRESGVSLGGIISVQTRRFSKNVTVTTSVDHQLSIGDPIEVRGLNAKAREAEGKYLVTSIPSSTSFIYRTTNNNNWSWPYLYGEAITAYTTIIPGAFFTGSDIPYDIDGSGIYPSSGDNTIRIQVNNYISGINTGTSVYITNTIGKKSFTISNGSDYATDSKQYIDPTTDTFYISGSDFFSGQPLTVTTTGTFPTTQTGAIPPTGSTTTTDVYNACKSALDSITGTTMTRHENMLMFNQNTNARSYSDGFTRTYVSDAQGTSRTYRQTLLYAETTNYNHFAFLFNSSGNYQTTYAMNQNSISAALSYSGNAFDLGSYFNYSSGTRYNQNLSGYLTQIGTPFVHNSLTPYILTVTEISDYSPITSNFDRIQFRQAKPDRRLNDGTYRNYDFYYDSDTPTSIGNGWEYTYAAQHVYGGWTSSFNAPGYLGMQIRVSNTGFPLYQSGNEDARVLFYNGYLAFTNNNYSNNQGTFYEVEVLIPYFPTTYAENFLYGNTGSQLTFNQIADQIATAIANSQTYATWDVTSNGTNNITVIPTSDQYRYQIKNSTGGTLDFSATSSDSFTIETETLTGVLDGYYNIIEKYSELTSDGYTTRLHCDNGGITIPNSRSIYVPHVDFELFDGEYYAYYPSGHGLVDTQKVRYYSSGGALGGTFQARNYYAKVADPYYFTITETPTSTASLITSVPASGTSEFRVFSIAGRGTATGTIESSEDSKIIIGTGTKFLSTYKIGDNFSLVSVGSTPNNYIINQVASILSDTSLTLTSNAGVTTTTGSHYADTKVNVRADGTFLHRPFDGGVEITAGTSPNSQIVRQTRKYFRYQSGKGIQCSMAINFNPSRPGLKVDAVGGAPYWAKVTTEYSHNLKVGDTVKIEGITDVPSYNVNSATVQSITDNTFIYGNLSAPVYLNSEDVPYYTIQGYSDAGIRAGLFDFQNGFFFEYDGQDLYAVRRSSVLQLPGTVNVQNKANRVYSDNTASEARFQNRLAVGDMVVIRGQSYRVSNIPSDTYFEIEPSYRGTDTTGAILTKTVDTKVPQSQWNIDKADGSGPSGFNLDISKIQMVYLDYSWYGAGKIRFGFKDTYGKVKYMHQFIHNNQLNEAYMRSGNIPARYEAFNLNNPTFVPSLFHWGTSVIMDGGFDDDDSYLFTASGNTLTFTNGDLTTATTNADSSLYAVGRRYRDYYVQIPFSSNDAAKFSAGIALYTAGGELNGETVAYTAYGSTGTLYVYIYIGSGYFTPASYPIVPSGTSVSIGAPAAGTSDVDLSVEIPLISIRLAPSVDNNLIGELGARDIINRMQLKLRELGVSISHDAEIRVILNGSLSNLDYKNVGTPSLSQYIAHEQGDEVNGGITIYRFRASGGATDSTGKRLVASNAFDLSQLVDLGNSILGGDGVFPNGPDIVTITAQVINTAEIDSASSFQVSSRLSWAESQA